MQEFSALQREAIVKKLSSESFDLLIIGGGITGAGIALDAASRGLKIALVERDDFAYGTSSRSTKLIHGGLRYLKQLEFGLVKEVGSERAIVHTLAPHLVVPEKMLLPLSEKRGLGYWLTSIGLKVYDWLAGVKPEDQRRMLTRPQTLKAEPLLRKDDIKGGAIYAEYRTDDARLTIEIMKTAVQHGATAISYMGVTDFIYDDGKICGVIAMDILASQAISIKARVVVSAAGPWVDDLREINKSKQGKRLHLTKGVHIVLPHEKLPVKQAIYFDVEDGRMIFAIPRGRTTYVGTTDTNYSEDKNNVVARREDAEYLIAATNFTFPSVNLTTADIESSWAGLRPLIHEEGKSASDLSRKDEIFESSTGLISIAGGKLTGYRKMAERVVNLVVKNYYDDRDLKECFTEKIRLTPAPMANHAEVRQYIAIVFSQLKGSGFTEKDAEYLVGNYGKSTTLVLDRFKETTSSESPELTLLKAELWYCVHNEMITTLQDFFIRRTGLAYFNITKVTRHLDAIAQTLATYLHWPPNRITQETTHLTQLLSTLRNIR